MDAHLSFPFSSDHQKPTIRGDSVSISNLTHKKLLCCIIYSVSTIIHRPTWFPILFAFSLLYIFILKPWICTHICSCPNSISCWHISGLHILRFKQLPWTDHGDWSRIYSLSRSLSNSKLIVRSSTSVIRTSPNLANAALSTLLTVEFLICFCAMIRPSTCKPMCWLEFHISWRVVFPLHYWNDLPCLVRPETVTTVAAVLHKHHRKKEIF